MSNPERLLTAPDVADQLNVSRWQVTRLARSGTLRPAVKLHGRTGPYLFRAADVDALASQRSAS